ncbi:hypothetical protein BDV36DRAFT_13828 [Aspergillus pseudocaelatus]|uniref:Fungal-type protein kinase domain-containing protein n=1 Tax=Aspergillus pseudocaelatus TaxID=1825620 RepID=A0ABQ6WF65_9EURO|nr:hypothetical protein BDV36DRAFT_13828 [Aspergillus pseudocaelatus]
MLLIMLRSDISKEESGSELELGTQHYISYRYWPQAEKTLRRCVWRERDAETGERLCGLFTGSWVPEFLCEIALEFTLRDRLLNWELLFWVVRVVYVVHVAIMQLCFVLRLYLYCLDKQLLSSLFMVFLRVK